VATQSKAHTVLNQTMGSGGSNHAWNMNIHLHFHTFCCLVYAEALQWIHPQSEKSYLMYAKMHSFRRTSVLAQTTGSKLWKIKQEKLVYFF